MQNVASILSRNLKIKIRNLDLSKFDMGFVFFWRVRCIERFVKKEKEKKGGVIRQLFRTPESSNDPKCFDPLPPYPVHTSLWNPMRKWA